MTRVHPRPTLAQWVSGARPRTLPAAVAPVAVGTGAALGLRPADAGWTDAGWAGAGWTDTAGAAGWAGDGWAAGWPGRALLALIVALALQIGVNYANDYSDGIRGTDDERVGPFRLTGSGVATPASVRRAAFGAFGVAALAGLTLVAVSGTWWLLAVGALSIAAAWYYTGGRRPYGYAGFGEVFVFVFFGLVAVLGTTYTQAGRVGAAAVLGAVGVGALACAILVANNLRDVPTDAVTGKRTLAVRLGAPRSRNLYAGLVGAGFVAAVAIAALRLAGVDGSGPGGGTDAVANGGRLVADVGALLALLAVPLAVRPVRTVLTGAAERALLPVLRDTGRLELVYGLLLGVGLALR
jgi:1,4-dihydroxy-2-naphthoate octaprenyltransferase